MYFTHLQTTLFGAVLGLISGGAVYVAGSTGLVPAFKTSATVAFGGMTAMGTAIAALTYSACKVKRVEWEDTTSNQIEYYYGPPSNSDFELSELPEPIPTVEKPLPPPPVFTYQPQAKVDPSYIYAEGVRYPNHQKPESNHRSKAFEVSDELRFQRRGVEKVQMEEEKAESEVESASQEWIPPVQTSQPKDPNLSSPSMSHPEPDPWSEAFLSQPIDEEVKPAKTSSNGTSFQRTAFEDLFNG